MTTDIGRVKELRFFIYKGKTFAFDCVWWADTAKTVPRIITSARGKIKDSATPAAQLLVNLAPTFLNNRVMIRLTEAQTLAIAGTSGFLELEATSGTETKVLTLGRVVLHPEVSE